MANGLSIHIGLNRVDPDAYDGWDGQLSGCINDATAMQRIADIQGFVSQMITDDEATHANVIQAISESAKGLKSGDMLLLTYSGHGGQVPDAGADPEDDGMNETWVLYDKMLLDDELDVLWGQFSAGVRIFVLSDSCHSGTMLRMLIMKQLGATKEGRRAYGTKIAGPMREKAIPREHERKHYARLKDDYTALQYLARGSRSASVDA